jgi:hypothetical protein
MGESGEAGDGCKRAEVKSRAAAMAAWRFTVVYSARKSGRIVGERTHDSAQQLPGGCVSVGIEQTIGVRKTTLPSRTVPGKGFV